MAIYLLNLHLYRATHNAVKQTAALCLLKMLRVNPKAIPIDQHAARIVQLINDKHLVSVSPPPPTFCVETIYMYSEQKPFPPSKLVFNPLLKQS